jgi:adenylylsulfate kinase
MVDLSHQGCVLWFTGLSGAGKSTISQLVANSLKFLGCKVELLDGDAVRTHLSKGLGFSREDRNVNVLRIGYVCQLLSRNGVIAIAAAISPYRDSRDQLKASIPGFIEIFVDCPLEECINRDVKGLYAKALSGQIPNFTGVSDPYEPPHSPDLVLRTWEETILESGLKIFTFMNEHRYLEGVDQAAAKAALTQFHTGS